MTIKSGDVLHQIEFAMHDGTKLTRKKAITTVSDAHATCAKAVHEFGVRCFAVFSGGKTDRKLPNPEHFKQLLEKGNQRG